MSPPARGAFIVIEGLDRSGKSTQVARLVDRIQSATTTAGVPPVKAVALKFPGESPPFPATTPFLTTDADAPFTTTRSFSLSTPTGHIAIAIAHPNSVARRTTRACRPNDSDRKDDRRVSALRSRARRPRRPPPLFRQQMGTRVRSLLFPFDVRADWRFALAV